MDENKVNAFISRNRESFPNDKILLLKERLMSADESKYNLIISTELKSPSTMFIISIVFGGFGVDRFMEGSIGMGVLKLLTGGVFGIMTIYDWCTISKRVREANFNKILELL